jgi:RNA ligase
MNYKFPIINDISEVRTAIKGRPEFLEIHKHDYIVFNYAVATPETFPKVEGWKNAILRECRGLIFNKEGKLIRRPYHKFFNLNEREETSDDVLTYYDSNWHVLEKLDGSMIAPFYSEGKIRWGTKLGITDITYDVEKYISNKPEYEKFATEVVNKNYTPIFEWCSNKNRIVVSYPEDKLILTAIRNNITGNYFPIF